MNEKYFPELARRLRQQNIETGQSTRSSLPVLVDGQEVMWIEPRGDIVLKAGALDDPLVDQVYETAIRASAQVHEYTEAMASAPRLEADGLRDNFRLLASFNGVVLAGREMEGGLGYEFTTWRRDGDGTGVAHGEYYHNDYAGAKLDFACRSGLVQESRLYGALAKAPFSFRGERRGKGAQCGMPEGRSTWSGLCLDDEQLTEIYRCIYETMDGEYPISEERRAVLSAAAEQIERGVDNGVPAKAPFGFRGERRGKEAQCGIAEGCSTRSGLCPDEAERVGLSNQQELDAAEQQADSGPGWEMVP